MTTEQMIKKIRGAIDDSADKELDHLMGIVPKEYLDELVQDHDTDRNQIHAFMDDVEYLLAWAKGE